MNIKQTIFAKIIENVEQVLAKNKELPPPAPDTRTEQQRALDEFFSMPHFCEHHEAVANLVGILTGYRPKSKQDAVKVVQFQIMYCNKNKVPWIVLLDDKGFASFKWGKFHCEAGCERLATPEEAAKFLEEFKKADPDKFWEWCRQNLETRWMFDL